MYTCLECRESFDEYRSYREPHGEIFLGCPDCAGAFIESIDCDICNCHISNTYFVTTSGRRYCFDCITEYELGEEF